ncbi:MAG: NAD-dependent epimerase/dehydratase family protein [bacterium]
MEKILVTGAGGFLGRYIVKILISKGYRVHGLGRSIHEDLVQRGVVWHQCDIRDAKAVQNATKGVDAVIHCASKIAMWGDWNDFVSINIHGTQNIINACLENKIQKLVYTSTPSVVFGRESIQGGDERLDYPKDSVSRYGRSKAMAEKNVLAVDQTKLYTCALRPHLIFGPGDDHLVPRLVEAAKKNRLKIIGDGENEVDVIAVENAAVAHVQALENLGEGSRVNGQAYFIAQDEPVKLWQFTNTLLKLHGQNPLDKSVSFPLAYFIGACFEFLAKVFRIKKDNLPMTRFVAMQLAKSHWFRHDKARDHFQYEPRLSTEQALEQYGKSLNH